jgi:hypothetical protein
MPETGYSPECDKERSMDNSEAHSSSLPMRVRSGSFLSDHFVIETSQEVFEIPWDKIELLALGIVEEEVGETEGPKSGMRNFIRKVFFGDETSQKGTKKQMREVYLLDMYVGKLDVPFRFESTSINYRKLLKEAGYVSFQNFMNLAQSIARHCTASRFDASCFEFLSGRKDLARRYGSVYDFDLESHTARAQLKDQRLRSDLFPAQGAREANIQGGDEAPAEQDLDEAPQTQIPDEAARTQTLEEAPCTQTPDQAVPTQSLDEASGAQVLDDGSPTQEASNE